MEPENDGFQKESPFPGGWFSGSMLNFRGVGGTPPRKLEKMDPFLTSILFRWVGVSTNQPDSYTTRVLKSSRSGAFFEESIGHHQGSTNSRGFKIHPKADHLEEISVFVTLFPKPLNLWIWSHHWMNVSPYSNITTLCGDGDMGRVGV